MATKVFYDLVCIPEENNWYACVYQFDIEGHRVVTGSGKDLHTTENYPTKERAVAVVKTNYPTAELVNVN